MPAFIEKAPSGLEHFVDQNEDEEERHHFQQDVQPVMDYAKALRNDGLTDSGIKREFWHYAILPPVVILKLRYEYGIDVFKRDHQKRMMEIINRDFPNCKTTNKMHTVKH